MKYLTLDIEFVFDETKIQGRLTNRFNIYTVATPTDLKLFPKPDKNQYEDYLFLTYQLKEEQVHRLLDAIIFWENLQEEEQVHRLLDAAIYWEDRQEDKFFIIIGTVMSILGCNPYSNEQAN